MDLRRLELGWLGLRFFFLLLCLLLHYLLVLHQGDVLLPGHTRVSFTITASSSITSCVPRCVGQLLHLEQGVWLNLVFDARVLVLSI